MSAQVHDQHNGQDQAATISQALQATLDPHVNNERRHEALNYLESIKHQSDAPYHGFNLAENTQLTTPVRYFGLQLLEYSIRYLWSTYDETQITQLRRWIVALAQSTSQADLPFFRNKVAQIWTECAKRCWGEEWLDMDESLQQLWQVSETEQQPAKRLLVLYIIETLAEDICGKDDVAAGLRLEVLGAALNEIAIPERLYLAHTGAKSKSSQVRHGHEGWLARICTLASDCIKQVHIHGASQAARSFRSCAIKALSAMRALVIWMSLKGILEVRCIECLSLAFHTQDVGMRICAVENLYAIMSRPHNAHFTQHELALLSEVLQADKLRLLGAVFEGARFLPSEDDDVYMLQRKTSELLSVLSDAILVHAKATFSQDAMVALYELLLEAVQNKSLLISIPVLHSLSKIIRVSDARFQDLTTRSLGLLVDLCSERLLNYEMLPEDTDVTTRFLYQDFDIMPERHAFLGNYRRYCSSILDSVVREEPLDVVSHMLGKVKNMLESGPYRVENGFDLARYAKTAIHVLQFDAQFSAVVSAIKGYAARGPGNYGSSVDKVIQQWCLDATTIRVDDPEIASHILTIFSTILRTTRAGKEIFLQIMHSLLTLQLQPHLESNAYTDSLKGFEALRVLEFQKIALLFADELFQYYDDLETKVQELIHIHRDDDRVAWGFRAFLFIITQRTKQLDEGLRATRLREMISPVFSAWHDPALRAATETLEAFCSALGIENLTSFYEQKQFDQISDWAAQELDADGRALQANLRSNAEQLPLRMTKSLLAATTEKLRDDSSAHDTASMLWEDSIQIVLPTLLNMIRHAQAFSNPARWTHLPAHLQRVIRRTLQDRFWQSGISNESRDEFYARINGSKTSYEGFASTVRGTMRNIREQGYHIIFLFTKFEEQVYGLADLPEPIASALFDDAEALAAHHLQPLINLATGLVQRCPPHHCSRFLPPLLRQMFTSMDRKISNEWQAVIKVNEQSADDDDLSEEMRIESVLRQLSYSMVTFVAFLVELDKANVDVTKQPRPRVSEVVLSDITVLEPLIMFCTHALRMRDTRSCALVCKILIQSLLPHFNDDTEPAPQVREFISAEVLQAAITSLNEPYFVDMQRDIAALIAQILLQYSAKTSTPRSVLLSLPNMDASKVDTAIDKITRTKSARSQRSIVLVLLEGVRGVSIHEAGRIARPDTNRKDRVQSQYMEVEKKPTIVTGDDTGLDAISSLFGDN